MSHKIVGISHSSNSTIKLYIKNQLNAIKQYKSAVTTVEKDETYSVIQTNITPAKRNRLPMLVYFKNNKFVDTLHGKYDNTRVLQWVDSLGIT